MVTRSLFGEGGNKGRGESLNLVFFCFVFFFKESFLGLLSFLLAYTYRLSFFFWMISIVKYKLRWYPSICATARATCKQMQIIEIMS